MLLRGEDKLRRILQIFTVQLLSRSPGKLSFEVSICSYKCDRRVSRLSVAVTTHEPKGQRA